MIKNFKTYFDVKKQTGKMVLATVSLAAGLSLTSCGTNETTNIYDTLDINEIESETTTVEERREYYEKRVDDVMYKMTDEEKDHFNTTINLDYENEEAYMADGLIFLRNDNVYIGDVTHADEDIDLPPGIYRIISTDVEENNGILGEFKALTPGEEIDIMIDYNTKTISPSNAQTIGKSK